MKLRFRLTDPGTGAVLAEASGVKVKYYRAPRYGLTELLATHVGDGIYEAEILLRRAGAYYVYVAAPLQRMSVMAFMRQKYCCAGPELTMFTLRRRRWTPNTTTWVT